MKYSKTTLMELSHKYRDILKKCALFNAAILLSVAISTQAWADHVTITTDTSFDDDQTYSHLDGHGYPGNASGGGLYVDDGATVTFNGAATFTDNTASGTSSATGGALATGGDVNLIFNGTARFIDNSVSDNNYTHAGAIEIDANSNIVFNGDAYFRNNVVHESTGDVKCDIKLANFASLTFNGTTTLDGGIHSSGGVNSKITFGPNSELYIGDDTLIENGNIEFKPGSKLHAKLNNSTALIQFAIIRGTTALVVEDYTTDGVFKLYSDPDDDSEWDGLTIADNTLYDITDNEDGTYNVTRKTEEEVADDVEEDGVDGQVSRALAAMTAGSTDHPVLAALSEALQTGHIAAAEKGAKDLAPTTSQAVMGIAQSINGILGNVADNRIAGKGRSGGDTFVGGSAWVQGIYNHAKQDASGNSDGFSSNTAGLALGVDGKVNNALTIGVGYAYTNTDADSKGRDLDVDGHNIFVYGSYQPNAWYIKTLLNYGLNKYTEKKSPMGMAMKAKYDVNTFAANVLTGYDLDNGITPEGGFRYLLVDQESYNDGAQRISNKKNDVLTAVAGVKYTTNVKASDWTLKPTLRLAATYDLLSDNSKANVNIIDGGSYQITGKRLHRFGIETGVGVTSSINNWDLSLEYNGGFRKDFQNHSGMLKAKYNF